MRRLVNWKDHIVEFPDRFKMKSLGNDEYEMIRSPGKIIQQGTPQNGTNFNTMDYAALEAMLMAAENNRMLLMLKNTVSGLVGEKVQLELKNTKLYPHNNSKKTIKLLYARNNMDYTIEYEIVSVEGGSVGEIEFSDKLMNGFKIAYTGSAKSVVMNCYVRGGI